MSQTSLQLLLHAGEVEYIIKNIKESNSKGSEYVGGCLFGLWRNSLKQPVIQFVTGPGKSFVRTKSVDTLFTSDYFKECASMMKKNHCLLHLGFWFSGSSEQQSRAQEIVMAQHSPYNVLLVVRFSKQGNVEQLSGEYFLRKDNPYIRDASPLFREDVLEGHSSFRKFDVLTRGIKEKGSNVSPVIDGREVGRKTLDLLKGLPSRVQVEEAVTSDEQWYSTDDGMKMLQLLFQYFQEEGVAPEMSRDTNTQDMQFGLGDGYTLDFPANFPTKMPIMYMADGTRCTMRRQTEGDVCRAVVDAVTEFLRKQQSSRDSRRRGGGSGGGRY